jgi:hypothetical protein
MITADLSATLILHENVFLRILDTNGDVAGFKRLFQQQTQRFSGHDASPD